MRRNDGIVIVASLIVMMVVLAIGAGMLFLTQSNLKIADNARSKASAQALADSGLDAVFIGLEHYYDINDGNKMPSFDSRAKTFSADFRLPTISAGNTNNPYTVEEFGSVGTGSNYRLKVSASTGNGAKHVSEILFEGMKGENTSRPVVANGLRSEGVITLNGRSNFVSAGLHGNAGYALRAFTNTTWRTCLARNPNTGVCTNAQNIAPSSIPVSAASNRTSWTCEPNNVDVCVNNEPVRKTDPITVTPDYVGRRDAAILAASRGMKKSNIFNINCDTLYTVAPTGLTTSNLASKGFSSGKTVCIESGTISFPNGVTLNGVNVISRGSIALPGNSAISLISSLLVSTTGSVTASSNKVTIRDSRVFSQGDLTFNGQQSSLEGMTTLASAGSITVNGSSKITNVSGEPKIGVGFVAEGDVTINGNSNWFAVSMVGGEFKYNGRAILFGSVAAVGSITINGGIDIDSGMAITNDDFLTTSNQETLAENSRR